MLFFLLSAFIELEAAEQKKKRRAKREEIDPLRGLRSLCYVFGLIIIVPILFFLYNMAMDPLTPTLVKNVGEIVSERTFGYLSARGNKKKSGRGDSEHES